MPRLYTIASSWLLVARSWENVSNWRVPAKSMDDEIAVLLPNAFKEWATAFSCLRWMLDWCLKWTTLMGSVLCLLGVRQIAFGCHYWVILGTHNGYGLAEDIWGIKFSSGTYGNALCIHRSYSFWFRYPGFHRLFDFITAITFSCTTAQSYIF